MTPSLPGGSRGLTGPLLLSQLRSSGLARYQLNDRDDPSSLPGLLTEVRVLRVDAVSKIPQPLPLGFVFHDFAAERQAAENDVGMLAEVVVPGWVLRPPPQRRDDRYPIAVVEVQRGIPTRLPCPCASRLEQRRGNRCRGTEPTSRELQQIRVDLPGDVDGKPGPRLARREPAHREIKATPSLIRIHAAQLGSPGHGLSLPVACRGCGDLSTCVGGSCAGPK